MPWEVIKKDNLYCVIKEDTDESEGCHESRAEAIEQVRALYASEKKTDKKPFSSEEEFCGGDDGAKAAVYHLTLAKKSESPDEVKRHLEEALMALLGEENEHKDEDNDEHKDDDHGRPAYVLSDEHFDDALSEDPLSEAVTSEEELSEDDAVEEELSESELTATDEEEAVKLREYAWEGPIVFEGQATGDNRYFRPGAIQWDEDTLPWAYRWQKASTQGHAGAVPIGRVDSIERQPGGIIFGKGVIIPGLNEEAAEYLRLMEAGVASGVSVDGDSAEFDVLDEASGKPRIEFSSMRLRSLTAVDIPAFDNARISLTSKVDELARRKKKKDMMKKMWVYNNEENHQPLTAAAIPCKPPVEWFLDPKFKEATPITVSKDGAVSGHLALFNTCHIGFPGSCITPPRNSKYMYFHTGEVETQEGDLVDVGHLTFNTGHASMADNAAAAAAHYDNTGTVAADVRCGEDKHGIWVAGALRSTLSDEDIRMFRAAPLSGDWRRIAGKLELVGALAVNVPGFPVPRVRAMVASGETEALITFTEEDESFATHQLIQKIEMASRIAADEDEFAGFLATIDNEYAIEEFYNSCHGKGGRFCGGSGRGGSGKSGKSKVAGRFVVASPTYFKERLETTKAIKELRSRSDLAKKVTVGKLQGILPYTNYGNVKTRALAKSDLSQFSRKDLQTVHDRLRNDRARFNRVVIPTDLFSIPEAVVSMVAYRSKKKAIDTQLTRVGTHLQSGKTSKVSAAIDDEIALSTDELLATEAEMLAAPATIKDGKPSDEAFEALGQIIALLIDDEDVPAAVRKKLRSLIEDTDTQLSLEEEDDGEGDLRSRLREKIESVRAVTNPDEAIEPSEEVEPFTHEERTFDEIEPVADGTDDHAESFEEPSEPIAGEGLQGRIDRKQELASKLGSFLGAKDKAEVKIPIPDDDLPEAPTKKAIEAYANAYTRGTLYRDLKEVRALLDDPDETMSKTMRKNIEDLYALFIATDKKSGKKTEASGLDIEEFYASGMDFEEFYNSCHAPKSGRFCPTAGGKSGGKGSKISGKAYGPPKGPPGGPPGGPPKGPPGGPPGGGGLLSSLGSQAVKQFRDFRAAKNNAKRWMIVSAVATAVANVKPVANVILPGLAHVSPLLASPAAVGALAIGGGVAAYKSYKKARTHKTNFNQTIDRINVVSDAQGQIASIKKAAGIP